MKLTGNCRYRSTFFGKLVLQVEYSREYSTCGGMDSETALEWRDAKLQDLNIIQPVEVRRDA
jgi:hypothetical protein